MAEGESSFPAYEKHHECLGFQLVTSLQKLAKAHLRHSARTAVASDGDSSPLGIAEFVCGQSCCFKPNVFSLMA